MDPSSYLCRIRDSFNKTNNYNKYPVYLPYKKSLNRDIKKIYNIVECSLEDTKNNRRDFSTSPYADNLYNPFSNYKGKFMNTDSIILADTDAFFNFTDHVKGFIIKQDTRDFNFAVLNDGPGGFSEYLQYRLPNSYGYGMTPSVDTDCNCNCFQEGWSNWNTDVLDMTHFNITSGASGTGDLNKDYLSFISHVKKVNAVGVDLLVIGEDDVQKLSNPYDYIPKLLVSLNVLKVGSTMICKISNLDNSMFRQLLYLTADCYNKISLFKPLATDLREDIYFLVAEGLNKNNIDTIIYLEKLFHKLSEYKEFCQNSTSIISEIPKDFNLWIDNYLLEINKYRDYVTEILDYEVAALYDTFKCSVIWNLP